jgi:hypothetical protein
LAPELPVAAAAIASSAETPQRQGMPELQAERVYSIVEWSAPTSPEQSEARCTAGEAIDCLRMSSIETGSSQQAVARRRYYQERAFSLLVLQCRRRVPDACAIIARMHARQSGLPRDPANEAALIARTRQLCLHRSGTACRAFLP